MTLIKNSKKFTANEYITVALVLQVSVLLVRLVGTLVYKNYALLFESFHILTDVVVTGVVLVAIRISSSRFSKRYSYGLYRIEDLVSLFIAAVIAFTAIDLLLSMPSAKLTYDFQSGIIQLVSVVPLFFSGIVKIIGGRRVKSPSLTSDGYHNYSDVYVGLGVGIGLLVSFATGIGLFYYIAIGLAAISILYTSVKIGKESITGIMDLPKDKKVIPRIKGIISENDNVTDVRSIKARWAGPVIFVEIVLTVNSWLTINEAHDVADSLERRVQSEIPDIRDVVIHIEPSRSVQRVVMIPVSEKNEVSPINSRMQRYSIIALYDKRRVSSITIDVPSGDIQNEKHSQRVLNVAKENGITDMITMSVGQILFSLFIANHIAMWKAQSGSVEENIELFIQNRLVEFPEWQ